MKPQYWIIELGIIKGPELLLPEGVKIIFPTSPSEALFHS